MSVTRTVVCDGKSVHHRKTGDEYTIYIGEETPPAAASDPAEPQTVRGPSLYLHDITKEEFDAFEPGRSYTLTIS